MSRSNSQMSAFTKYATIQWNSYSAPQYVKDYFQKCAEDREVHNNSYIEFDMAWEFDGELSEEDAAVRDWLVSEGIAPNETFLLLVWW